MEEKIAKANENIKILIDKLVDVRKMMLETAYCPYYGLDEECKKH